MIKYVKSNIFDVECDYILHQTNCFGVAGAGLALQIRNKVPGWFQAYQKYCREHNALGSVQVYKHIINMFGQYGYGRYGKHTDYAAVQKALRHLNCVIPKGSTIAIPYNLGCGLAGGNWDIMLSIVSHELTDYTVIICSL